MYLTTDLCIPSDQPAPNRSNYFVMSHRNNLLRASHFIAGSNILSRCQEAAAVMLKAKKKRSQMFGTPSLFPTRTQRGLALLKSILLRAIWGGSLLQRSPILMSSATAWKLRGFILLRLVVFKLLLPPVNKATFKFVFLFLVATSVL